MIADKFKNSKYIFVGLVVILALGIFLRTYNFSS